MEPAFSWNTVQPGLLSLIYSITELPQIITKNIQPHLGVDPLIDSFFAALAFAFISWFLSVLTNNYSWVDRLWSLLPPSYILIFAFRYYQNQLKNGVDAKIHHLPMNERLALMAGLSVFWGLRLTFNFARKGGYHPSSEDYRWAIVRSSIPEFVFQLFNIVFIALYQNILLWLIAAPTTYFAYISAKRSLPLNWLDYTAAGLIVFLVLIETIADQQQWNFQNNKHKLISEKKPRTGDAKRGFLTKGLFAFSRHPNFFAEISIWFCFYLFSVSASGFNWVNWTLVGPTLLLLLFQGSTNFTESISIKKYPQYLEYQKTTSRLIPLWPGNSLPEDQPLKKVN